MCSYSFGFTYRIDLPEWERKFWQSIGKSIYSFNHQNLLHFAAVIRWIFSLYMVLVCAILSSEIKHRKCLFFFFPFPTCVMFKTTNFPNGLTITAISSSAHLPTSYFILIFSLLVYEYSYSHIQNFTTENWGHQFFGIMNTSKKRRAVINHEWRN